jgi:hypothetical protein
MAIRDRIADIIADHMVDVDEVAPAREDSLEAADAILKDDGVIGHFEQREANEQVRRMRRDHRCPTCGSEQ